jgi:alpha-N-arabinofuranosidase
MANIAQIINVLQAMILTKDNKMALTPTYHVFEMMNVHQGATYLPIDLNCDTLGIEIKPNIRFNETVPVISASASKDQSGAIHITLANVDLKKSNEVTINLADVAAKAVTGRILASKTIADYNTFEQPNLVAPKPFTDAKLNKGTLTVKLPPQSIVTLELK